MKIKLLLLFVVLFTLQTNAQTVTALQQQNARATGYAIVAARNPGKNFSVLLVKWDGINTLDYNAITQINPGWHAQAAVKGNYFDQPFNGTDFTMYSSVVVSQAEFDTYKSTGTDWWIVCSMLPAFSNSGLTIADNGNVGIGTTTPSEKLVVKGDGARIKLETNSNPSSYYSYIESNWNSENTLNIVDGGINKFGSKFLGVGTNDTYVSSYYGIGFATQTTTAANANVRMYINQVGNVGIGTTTPAEKLNILGNIMLNGTNAINTSQGVLKFASPTYPTAFAGIEGKTNSGGSNQLDLIFYTAYGTSTEQMRLMAQTGNLGIGTTHPDEKLTVKGKIHAEEIKVDLAVPADYVFQKYYTGKSELKSDYVMPTLAEIENFTKKNHHLPNVPSAQEVQQNGLSLGEMSNVLLQKVEELTLYAIEQNKVIEELKTQVAIILAKKQ